MMDDRFRETVERTTASLRAELERDLAAIAGDFTQALSHERDRAARATAEADGLKRTLADERERAAQIAAEAVATDMRRQAELQAQVAEAQAEARQSIEAVQRTAAEEREHAVQAAVAAAVANAQREAEREADAQIARLREAAQAHADDVRRSAEAQVADLRQTLHAQLDEVKRTAHAQMEQARRAADEQIAQARRLASDDVEEARRLAAAQVGEAQARADAQIADIRHSAAEQADDAQRRADAQVAEIREALDARIEDVRRRAAEQAEDAQRRADAQVAEIRHELDAQIADVRSSAAAEVEQARAEAARAAADAQQLRAEIDRARLDAEDVVIAQLAAAQAEMERQVAEAVARARAEAERAGNGQAERVLDAVRTLDEARSIGEVLDALADAAARHVERAVVLVVKDTKLRVRRACGLDLAPGAELERQAAGLAGAVITTGMAVARPVEPGDAQAGAYATLPDFGKDAGPRYAAAIPIPVGGRVVAVLYADTARSEGTAAPGRWPATLEVLARHTSRMLEMLTVLQATGMLAARDARRPAQSAASQPQPAGPDDEDAARRYARLLVSEIRMYHEPVVDAGRQSRDLRSRLGGEIDRARRLYDERVPQAVRERFDFFEQELVRTLADGDVSLLG